MISDRWFLRFSITCIILFTLATAFARQHFFAFTWGSEKRIISRATDAKTYWTVIASLYCAAFACVGLAVGRVLKIKNRPQGTPAAAKFPIIVLLWVGLVVAVMLALLLL